MLRLPDAPHGMFVHLIVEERGLRPPAPLRDVVQPGGMIAAATTAASPPTTGWEAGGGQPGVALGR